MSEETSNGDYEYISYRTYNGVGFERLMSWKASKTGTGRVSAGKIEMKPQKSDVDKENEVLLVGHSVVVHKMEFKLVRKD
ncbi:hypothetical protein P171DRAFT_239038 [Karstenula rhodostoma CBS 690.94]|uniref:Uncharacterized protein n=1 Tax=Karstenula rhodostoma CBS 690.94 TaxID=1392251 RepID=A0A9P4PMR1_9PLEO|nr:hypothetical protein P171DRAFT_239038 [Karstenula rhodostoma CBS 690.94]